MTILCYLLEELGDTLPKGDGELTGFIKGMAWMFFVLMVIVVVTTVTYQRAHP